MIQPVAILFCSFCALLIIVYFVISYGKRNSGKKTASQTKSEINIREQKTGIAFTKNINTSETDFETNIKGIYIAGELKGMNTLNNAAQQADRAVGYIAGRIARDHKSDFDLIIVGAGPAGISASLAAKANNLRFLLLEQYTLSGSITSNPKQKILVNGDVNLPLIGKVKLNGDKKSDLIDLFYKIVVRYKIPIQENCRVESIIKLNKSFNVISSDLQNFTTAAILLTIGRRGSPRKLNVPGESKEKVAYSITDIDNIKGERILIIGSNNAAVESALVLSGRNEVTIATRQEAFSDLTPLTARLIDKSVTLGSIKVLYRSRVMLIEENHIILSTPEGYIKLYNDLVFILYAGDSAEHFLEKAGISTAGVFVEDYHWQ